MTPLMQKFLPRRVYSARIRTAAELLCGQVAPVQYREAQAVSFDPALLAAMARRRSGRSTALDGIGPVLPQLRESGLFTAPVATSNIEESRPGVCAGFGQVLFFASDYTRTQGASDTPI
jgi:hypothetical protein